MPATDKRLPHLIYAIECTDGRRYVGATTRSLVRRWSAHRSQLKTGTHENAPLLRAWRKLGAASFSIRLLERVPGRLANTREKHWMDRLDSWCPRGFNLADPTRLASCAEKTWITVNPRGKVEKVTNLNAFAEKHGLTSECLYGVAHGRARSHHGWHVRPDDMSRLAWERQYRSHRGSPKLHCGPFEVTLPDGKKVFVASNLSKWAKARGLCPSALVKVAKGRAAHHRQHAVSYLKAN